MWVVNVLVNAATNYATGNNMLGALIVSAIAGLLFLYVWHRNRIKTGRRGVEPWHLIIGGMSGVVIFALVALAGVVWQMRAAPPTPGSLLQQSIDSFLGKKGLKAKYGAIVGRDGNVAMADNSDGAGPFIEGWDTASLGAWPTESDGFTSQQLRKSPKATPQPPKPLTVESLTLRQRALTQLEQFLDTHTEKILVDAKELMSADQNKRTPTEQIDMATAFLKAVQQYQPDQGKVLSRFNGIEEMFKLADWNWVAQQFEPALTEYIHTVRLLAPNVPVINAATHPAGGRFLTRISDLETWLTRARDSIARQRVEYDKAEVHK